MSNFTFFQYLQFKEIIYFLPTKLKKIRAVLI